ncbi:hypothetical protein QQ045_019606 [Rhodiola kirilowii]
MNDDSDDVYMSTLATLDNPIIDEYDRAEMEELENATAENQDAEIFQDRIGRNHPSFTDISAWETYRPFDENVRVHHLHSPSLQKGTTYWKKVDTILAVQKYSVLNRVEYKDSSPQTFVKWDVTPLDDECIHAFKHCRPLISIVDMHKFGKYNAKLLVAITLYANNHILSFSFALVESENTSSWKWFISCIREGVTQREGLCIVSDKHNEILAAMREPEWQEPMSYHRVCVCHLQSNFMMKVKDEVLKAKLGDVAYEKTELKFKESDALRGGEDHHLGFRRRGEAKTHDENSSHLMGQLQALLADAVKVDWYTSFFAGRPLFALIGLGRIVRSPSPSSALRRSPFVKETEEDGSNAKRDRSSIGDQRRKRLDDASGQRRCCVIRRHPTIRNRTLTKNSVELDNMSKMAEKCNIQVPVEVLNLIDDGKNPDEFTRDVINGCITKNKITKGKTDALKVYASTSLKNWKKLFRMKLSHTGRYDEWSAESDDALKLQVKDIGLDFSWPIEKTKEALPGSSTAISEVVARETSLLLEQQKRLSVRDLTNKFEKGVAAAAKLSSEAKLREAASLRKYVLLKNLRDSLESLKARVAGRNKDEVEEALNRCI